MWFALSASCWSGLSHYWVSFSLLVSCSHVSCSSYCAIPFCSGCMKNVSASLDLGFHSSCLCPLCKQPYLSWLLSDSISLSTRFHSAFHSHVSKTPTLITVLPFADTHMLVQFPLFDPLLAVGTSCGVFQPTFVPWVPGGAVYWAGVFFSFTLVFIMIVLSDVMPMVLIQLLSHIIHDPASRSMSSYLTSVGAHPWVQGSQTEIPPVVAQFCWLHETLFLLLLLVCFFGAPILATASLFPGPTPVSHSLSLSHSASFCLSSLISDLSIQNICWKFSPMDALSALSLLTSLCNQSILVLICEKLESSLPGSTEHRSVTGLLNDSSSQLLLATPCVASCSLTSASCLSQLACHIITALQFPQHLLIHQTLCSLLCKEFYLCRHLLTCKGSHFYLTLIQYPQIVMFPFIPLVATWSQ